MAEEQFNMMDDWFREAAEQDGPPAPAEAWEKMNTLLDAEEKKRRRFFFWWWLPILLGGAGILFYQALRSPGEKIAIARPVAPHNQHPTSVTQPSSSTAPLTNTASAKKSKAENQPPITTNQPPTSTYQPPTMANHSPAIAEHAARETGNPATGASPSPTVNTHQALAANANPDRLVKHKNHRKREEKVLQQLPNENAHPKNSISPGVYSNTQKYTEESGINKVVMPGNNPTPGNNQPDNNQPARNNPTVANNQPISNLSTSPQPDSTNTIQPDSTTTLQPDSAATLQSDPKHNPKHDPEPAKNPLPQDTTTTTKPGTPKQDNKLQRFYLYAGAAPEFSFTSGSQAGKTTLAWGGGLGFQPAKKLSIQAGFFVTKKIYSAAGNAYTPKPGSYYDNENYKIKNVEADCAIFEIPLQARYDFLQQKKQSFFMMASLTSTIMKEEYYSYDYTRYGQQAYSSHTYSTGSFKLFSGAGISIGLERKIGRSFYLMLAPYYNFPLRGVGEGSVKLNAAGILTGLRYQLPFPKK